MANILACDSGNGLSAGAFATAASNLGHTVTYLTSADAFSAQSLTGFSAIVRFESDNTNALKSLDFESAAQVAKLYQYIVAGGAFINLDDHGFGDPGPGALPIANFEGATWLPGFSLNHDECGAQTTLDIEPANVIFSSFVAANCDGTAGDLYEWYTFANTGGLSVGLRDVQNSRPVLLYGALQSGKVVFSLVANNSGLPAANTPSINFLTDLLTWVISGSAAPDPAIGTPGIGGADEEGFTCPQYGASINSESAEATPGRAIIADLRDPRRPRAYIGKDQPFTCGVHIASTCAGGNEQTDHVFCGDKNGYVNRILVEGIYRNGPWQNRDEWTVASGDANTVTVTTSGTVVFPTFGDRLRGMIATLIKTAANGEVTYQERVIVDNTSSKLTIYSPLVYFDGQAPWDTNPAAGDIIVVGLIRAIVEPAEVRTPRESYFHKLVLDHANPDEKTVRMQAQMFGGTGRSKDVRDETADATNHFTATTVDDEPDGVPLSPVESKGRSIRLLWDQPNGPYKITGAASKDVS